jgi:hypothetical protein
MRSLEIALVAAALVACSSSPGASGPHDASTALGPDAAEVIELGDAAVVDPGSFLARCRGVHTSLSGVALAPNGTDPVEAGMVEVWATPPAALPRGVHCEGCAQSAALAWALSASDGRFKVGLDGLPFATSYAVTVRKAGFRRVLPSVAVLVCADTPLDRSQTSLPGNSAEGDLPRIAVSSGNVDHLEKVLGAMGITEFDCVKGLPAGSAKDTCTRAVTLGALLADPTAMDDYEMIFIGCAVADTYEPTSFDDASAKNLRAWIARGGKLVATDDSYDFVEQTYPDGIDFAGTAVAAGLAQPPNTAEIGVYASSITGVVGDARLAAWLGNFPSTINAARQVGLTGFLSNWAVQRAPGPLTRVIVHGQASWTGGSGDVPLTSQFEVMNCGRVIFSSYHTSGNGSALIPQERILEYLLLEVGACIDVN